MRTISGAHRTLLGGQSLNFHHKVEVENESGTWIDLTAWCQGLDFNESIDSPVMGGVVRFLREHGTGGTQSLAPLMSASTLNVDDFAAYSPLLHPGRGFRYTHAVTAAGVAPVAGDWHLVFEGQLDEPDASPEPNTVSVNIRDIGARPLDQIIETEKQYGSDAGIPLESVIEQLWADNGFPGIAVSLPGGSPGALVHTYTQARGGSLFEAGRTLALQIGWDLRYRWGTGDAFTLTLADVDRTKTVSDITIPPSEYLKVTKAVIDDQFVRNVGKLKYTNGVTKTIGSVVASDSASINTFGRRYIEIAEDWTKGISSESEAQDMLDAVISDLKDPIVDFDIQTFYLWPVQLHDLVETPSNTVTHDSPQKLAVVGSQVSVNKDSVLQTLQTRGKPAGAYAEWIRRHGLGPVPDGGVPAPKFTFMLGEESHGGGVTGDGMVWMGCQFERNTREILFWAEEGEDDRTPTPDTAINSMALSLTRQEGVDSSADDWATVVGIATRPLRWRTIRARGIGPNGELGPEWMPPVVQAIDPTPAIGDAKIIAFSIATGQFDNNILAITPGLLAAGDNWIFIWRNGVQIGQIWIGQDTSQKFYTDTAINPNAKYNYEVFIWNNGVSGKHARSKAGFGTGVPAVWWDQQAPKLIWDSGSQTYNVALYWLLVSLPTADHIVFEISNDGIEFSDWAETPVASTVYLDPNVQPKWYRMRAETAADAILAYSSPAFWNGQGVPPSQGLVPPEWNPVPTARIIRSENLSIGVPGLVMGFICATSGAFTCAIQKSPDDGTTPWVDVYESGQLSGDVWTGGSVAENTWYRLQSRDASGAALTNSASIHWVPI